MRHGNLDTKDGHLRPSKNGQGPEDRARQDVTSRGRISPTEGVPDLMVQMRPEEETKMIRSQEKLASQFDEILS